MHYSQGWTLKRKGWALLLGMNIEPQRTSITLGDEHKSGTIRSLAVHKTQHSFWWLAHWDVSWWALLAFWSMWTQEVPTILCFLLVCVLCNVLSQIFDLFIRSQLKMYCYYFLTQWNAMLQPFFAVVFFILFGTPQHFVSLYSTLWSVLWQAIRQTNIKFVATLLFYIWYFWHFSILASTLFGTFGTLCYSFHLYSTMVHSQLNPPWPSLAGN